MLLALNSTTVLILLLAITTIYCVHEYMRDRVWAPSLLIWLVHVVLIFGSNVVLRLTGNYTVPTGFYTIWSSIVYAHAMLSVLGLIWVDRKVAGERATAVDAAMAVGASAGSSEGLEVIRDAGLVD